MRQLTSFWEFLNVDHGWIVRLIVFGIVVGTSLLSLEIAGYYDVTNESYYNDTFAAFIWSKRMASAFARSA